MDDFTLTYTAVTPDPDPEPEDPTTSIDFLAANVYVRLKAGLSQGSYNQTLTMTTGSTTANVTLSGTVTSRDFVPESFAEEKNPELSLYPNPAERGEAFHIELPAQVTLKEAKVEVFNILGEMIHFEPFEGNAIHNNYAAGTYTVRVTDLNGAVYYGKLIVR